MVKAFDRAYAAAKKEKGILDFHDFERYAMEILLSKSETGYAPSQAAKEYRAKYRYLVIDEYQDSSDAVSYTHLDVYKRQTEDRGKTVL